MVTTNLHEKIMEAYRAEWRALQPNGLAALRPSHEVYFSKRLQEILDDAAEPPPPLPATTDILEEAWKDIEAIGDYTHPGMAGGDVAFLMIDPEQLKTALRAAIERQSTRTTRVLADALRKWCPESIDAVLKRRAQDEAAMNDFLAVLRGRE
jgi:hypothetical protein